MALATNKITHTHTHDQMRTCIGVGKSLLMHDDACIRWQACKYIHNLSTRHWPLYLPAAKASRQGSACLQQFSAPVVGTSVHRIKNLSEQIMAIHPQRVTFMDSCRRQCRNRTNESFDHHGYHMISHGLVAGRLQCRVFLKSGV